MKRQFGCAARGIVTALFFGLAAPAMAADHRDAPGVDDDISTDITDVYIAEVSLANFDQLFSETEVVQ